MFQKPYSHSGSGQPHNEGAPPVSPDDVDSYTRGQAEADAIDFDRYADELLAHCTAKVPRLNELCSVSPTAKTSTNSTMKIKTRPK